MKLSAFAEAAAASISLSEAPALPIAMFSLMLVAKSVGSWPTSPTWSLYHASESVRRSLPSTHTLPLAGS